MFDMVPGINGRDDELEAKKAAAEVRLDALNSDLVVYTDGSADAGCRNGGAGVVVTRGPAANPTVLENIRVKDAALTSSFEEEVEAARSTIK